MGKLGDYIGHKVGAFEKMGGVIKESDWVSGEDMERLRAWAEGLPRGVHSERAIELVGQIEVLEENIAEGEPLPQADLLLAEVSGVLVGAGWADLEWGGEVYCINQLLSVGGAGVALMAAFARKALKWGAQMRTEAAIESGSDIFYLRVGASDYVETDPDFAWHGPVAREGDPYPAVWEEGGPPTRLMTWSPEAMAELAGANVIEVELV